MISRDLAPARRLARKLRPISGFLVVYIGTCYVGALALLAGPDWVREWYVYLSGASIERLNARDVITVLALLHLGPALVCLGWMISDRVLPRVRRHPRVATTARLQPDGKLVVGMFVVLLTYLSARIAATGALTRFGRGWLDYEEFVRERANVISHLGFVDFILIYSIVPLLAGAIIAGLVARDVPRRSKLVMIGSTFISVVVINLALFQKRPLLIAILLIGFVTVIYEPSRSRIARSAGLSTRRLKRWGGMVIASVYLGYLVLLMMPVLRDSDASASGDEGELVTAADFDTGPIGLTTAGSYLLQGARISMVPDGSGGEAVHVRTSRALEGISYDTGRPVATPTDWRLEARLRTSSVSFPVTLLLGHQQANTASQTFVTGRTWRPVSLAWRPETAVPAVSFAARSTSAGAFEIDDVRLRAVTRPPPPVPEQRPQPLLDDNFALGLHGWQASGPYVAGGARLTLGQGDPTPGLMMTTQGPRMGASYKLPSGIAAGTSYLLTLRVSASRTTPFSVFLGDGRRDTVAARATAVSAWSTISLAWRPEKAPRNASIGVRGRAPGTLRIDSVVLREIGGWEAGTAPVPESAVVNPPSTYGPTARSSPHTASGGVRFPAYGELGARDRAQGLAFYALFGPFTRTAGPAVAYPTIFPKQQPFNHIDLGLDVLGIESAPDDNSSSFRTMFPTAGAGVNSVPFQFTLYSQGGLIVALVGSFIIGTLWRLAWWVARRLPQDPVIAALAASLLVLFGVQIAGDSARNAVLSSYGILWPLLLLLLGMAVARMAGGRGSAGSAQRTGLLKASP